jgi:hypothetical protein
MMMMIESDVMLINDRLFDTIHIENVMTNRIEASDLLLKLGLKIGNLALQKLRAVPQK